jgi:hypothetical protein
MIIERTSELTGVTRVMEIDVCEQQIKDWEEGKLIQDAMPSLTPSEREFIMTGTTDEEWETMSYAAN